MTEFQSFVAEIRAGSEGARLVERNAARVLAVLTGAAVSRTRDAIQLEVGDDDDDDGLVVLVTAEALELRLPTTEWTMGFYAPEKSSRLWKRIAWRTIGGGDDGLTRLIGQAKERRRREFSTCRYCRRRVPPEHRTGRACHSCASSHLGIVY